MRKAKISHEDAVYWSSPLKQWESSRCIVLIVDEWLENALFFYNVPVSLQLCSYTLCEDF